MRIRSIKPEFWRSDDVNEMSIEDRLLFIGLWSYVDDNGVGIDRVSDVCADLFAHDLSVSPHDTLMRVKAGLNRLHTQGVISRYEVGAKRFLHIANWSKHQRINRPSPGRYPLPDKGTAIQNESITESSLSAHESSLPGAGEQGSRGTEEQGSKELAHLTASVSFEDFWSVWQKRVAKADAEKAWTKAIKKSDPQVIVDAAHALWSSPYLPERQFIPYPASWLNGERWNDPLPEPPEQKNRPSRDQANMAFVAQLGVQKGIGS
ncbi:hypothetical protein [Microbacterium sp. MPKO10]|uniref:hypothetical protein n=1 Tax=Microbacterium sp. MPKO10 TaxID=2989818 RepID=UPI002235F6D1|nr:hypothetical protein [Microbacterium sp. MPKO10]MCW4458164.1 hypothetical protein [Microbacterium sp. MPKO10]